jgi:hypothetical protein
VDGLSVVKVSSFKKNPSREIFALMVSLTAFLLDGLNSFHVMAVNKRPTFGDIFLEGHISLKNWTQRVILRHDTMSFKRTCFLITLKVLPKICMGRTSTVISFAVIARIGAKF